MGQTENRTKTPEQHVRKARQVADQIDQLDGVESAHVDDWGRSSNFQLAVKIEGSKQNDMPGQKTLYDLDVDLRSLRPQIVKLFEDTRFYFDEQYGNGGFETPETDTRHLYRDRYESGHTSRNMMIHFRHP